MNTKNTPVARGEPFEAMSRELFRHLSRSAQIGCRPRSDRPKHQDRASQSTQDTHGEATSSIDPPAY